ncbi:sigma-70 family RNA polymerase sigma factor [Actinocorallia longicatena]|uniref:RNA polymerase sigma factor SigJ n=1 Tax=Actinocorallia longicatena TaxID=111803 RepID=A0ABP6QIB9_9ACTN
MSEENVLAGLFEEHRGRLRSIGYRMLGSVGEADDAVQETWLRLSRTGAGEIENLGGWLTTVMGRVCLNVLRSREQRREEPLEVSMPDPIIGRDDGGHPEHEALLADSVGLALLVVLGTLAPAERVAFVLHDMFAVPFEEIAGLVERTPTATRQLASRARRRVREQAPAPDPDPVLQREVVAAFFAATRNGDLDALLAVLDPDVVLRSDGGTARPAQTVVLRGPGTVASQASRARTLAQYMHPALINGTPGAVVIINGRPFSIMAFSVVNGRILSIDVLADPDRLDALDLTAFA